MKQPILKDGVMAWNGDTRDLFTEIADHIGKPFDRTVQVLAILGAAHYCLEDLGERVYPPMHQLEGENLAFLFRTWRKMKAH